MNSIGHRAAAAVGAVFFLAAGSSAALADHVFELSNALGETFSVEIDHALIGADGWFTLGQLKCLDPAYADVNGKITGTVLTLDPRGLVLRTALSNPQELIVLLGANYDVAVGATGNAEIPGIFGCTATGWKWTLRSD